MLDTIDELNSRSDERYRGKLVREDNLSLLIKQLRNLLVGIPNGLFLLLRKKIIQLWYVVNMLKNSFSS